MSDSSNTAAKRSVKDVISDARYISSKKSAAAQESATESLQDRFAQMATTNKFAQIMLNSALSPEQKRDEMVQALKYEQAASKQENRSKIAAFNEFKEYLQEQRKLLNREGIKLQDTEAFAELQSVIDEMTKSSIDFQDKIKPLLEVLNAVFEIRRSDKITDVYREIENDKEWAKAKQEELDSLMKELDSTRTKLSNLDKEAARLSEERSFFGLGGVKVEAKMRIAEINNVEKKSVKEDVLELVQKIEQQKADIAVGPASDNPELLKQKAVLREFLDLTKDSNRDRQKDLINAAVKYVDTSDSRLKSVLGTLGRLGKHAEVMSDANGMLKNMHVIMDESLRSVTKEHESTKKDLAASSSDESSIARMTREEKLADLNDYITTVDEGAIDIANSIGGLTKHSVQIQAYKDTLRNETGSTKRLHLEGVSQMGEQLMSVISAISAAATSESRSIAANNFAKMAEQNQAVISQEVVRNATNIEIEANQISKLVNELQDYGDVLNASSQIANQGYSKMRDTVDAIRKVSGSVQDAIKDLVSDRADSGIASGQGATQPTTSEAEPKTSTIVNPFAKIGN